MAHGPRRGGGAEEEIARLSTVLQVSTVSWVKKTFVEWSDRILDHLGVDLRQDAKHHKNL